MAADSGFRQTALGYFNALWRLGLDLHLAIAADLGLPPSFFADKFDRPMATLRLLHYPPRDIGQRTPGAGEHTDYGSLTILLNDSVGGLEVRRRDGAWIEAPPIPGTFICNIGDCLMRWSNDTYRVDAAPRHQPGRPRPLFGGVLLRSRSGRLDRVPAGMQRARPAGEISADPGRGLSAAAAGRDLWYRLIRRFKALRAMAVDLILRNACIGGREPQTFDIAIADGRIAEIASEIVADGPEEDLAGRLVIPGFVETHIHLDKSCILDRCQSRDGTLAEAIAEVAAAKRGFTEDDVYERARRTLEKAILQGTTRMRTHVEVDPRIGLKSFQCDPPPQARLCLGDRPRDLRVPAGRPAQRSGHRGVVDRGVSNKAPT